MKSLSVERSIADLGRDLRRARIRRRFTVDDMAARAGVNRKTVMKLEKGDASVSLQALGSVMLILGEEHRLGEMLDAGKDDTGLLLDDARLPERVRSKKPVSPAHEGAEPEPDDSGFGVGF